MCVCEREREKGVRVEKMASWYVMFVFALVLVHATARNIPEVSKPNEPQTQVSILFYFVNKDNVTSVHIKI